MARPKVKRLAKRGDVEGLVAILNHRDLRAGSNGDVIDNAAGDRLLVVSALASMDDAGRGPGLAMACCDPHPRVRRTAAAALADRPDPASGSELAYAVAKWPEDDPDGQALAVTALSRTQGAMLGPSLVTGILETPRSPTELRELLLELLDRAEDADEENRTIHRLIEGLQDEQLDVRQRAATVTAWLDERPLDHLIVALKRRGPRAYMLVRALGLTHARGAVDVLVGLLEEAQTDMRREAVRALDEISDPRAIDALLSAADDEDHHVRVAAMEALNHLGAIGNIVGIGGTVRQQLNAFSERFDGTRAAPASAPMTNGRVQKLLGEGSTMRRLRERWRRSWSLEDGR